jgi:mannan endo-1,4-beta-mannosidase
MQLTAGGYRQDFVYVKDQDFYLNGKRFAFMGTNFYRIGLDETLTKSATYDTMQELADAGMKVVRMWAFACGNETFGNPIINWLSPHEINYNEQALRRLDIAVDAARRAGIKLILVMVNYHKEYCSMGWWAKQILGDPDPMQFYMNVLVREQFKNYLSTLLNRNNQVYSENYGWSLAYKDDPTIMAIELANEPRTPKWYEASRGWGMGDQIHDWLKDMSNFIRTIDDKHLIASGEEGFKTSHNYQHGSLDWMHNGEYGIDFVRNIALPNIDFATVHVYPQNFGVRSYDFWWIRDHILVDRAYHARQVNKPIVLEEVGFNRDHSRDYLGYRDAPGHWFEEIAQIANDNGYRGMLFWQIVPDHREHGWYTYYFSDPIFQKVDEQTAYYDWLNEQYPVCENPKADADGDGWGFEDEVSCRMPG